MDYRTRLTNKISSFGGSISGVDSFCGEEINTRMIDEGVYFDGAKSIVNSELEAGKCHENSIMVWLKNRDKLKICTGYCRSKDLAWYRHSWCVDEDGVVYECTPIKRDCYYGLPLTYEETLVFIEAALYPDQVQKIRNELNESSIKR